METKKVSEKTLGVDETLAAFAKFQSLERERREASQWLRRAERDLTYYRGQKERVERLVQSGKEALTIRQISPKAIQQSLELAAQHAKEAADLEAKFDAQLAEIDAQLVAVDAGSLEAELQTITKAARKTARQLRQKDYDDKAEKVALGESAKANAGRVKLIFNTLNHISSLQRAQARRERISKDFTSIEAAAGRYETALGQADDARRELATLTQGLDGNDFSIFRIAYAMHLGQGLLKRLKGDAA